MQNLTALQIINRAANELGLNTTTEVAASTELTGQQMLALLNAAGNDLLMAHAWSELNVTHTFQTVIGNAAYTLPADYAYYIDQTMWNKSTFEPVYGPITPQEWQSITAGITGPVVTGLFRIQNNAVEFLPIPASLEDITYQYVSANWVTSGQSGLSQPYILTDLDVPRINSELLIKALKVKMWNAKGLDTTLLIAEYSELFSYLIGKDKGARVLSLSPRYVYPYLSARNVPDGSWQV